MYLCATKYVGNWPHDNLDERAQFNAIISAANLPKVATSDEGAPSLTLSINIAYWRKDNAIHAWFVKNVQNGEDNCGDYSVSREQLEELVKTCRQALASRDTTKLPPQSGFFFGSTHIDKWYWEGLTYTADRIEELLACKELEDWGFEYHSSW